MVLQVDFAQESRLFLVHLVSNATLSDVFCLAHRVVANIRVESIVELGVLVLQMDKQLLFLNITAARLM